MGAGREPGAGSREPGAGSREPARDSGSRGKWDSGDKGSVKSDGNVRGLYIYIYTAARAVWGWSVGDGGKCEGFVFL